MKTNFTMMGAALALLASPAFAGPSNLEDYDAVLDARFSINLAQTNNFFVDRVEPVSEVVDGPVAVEPLQVVPQKFSITSNTLLRGGGYPKTARTFFVFSAGGPYLIEGGLVVADQETGEIYGQIAQCATISIGSLMDGPGGFTGLFEENRGRLSLTTNMLFNFYLDGIEFSCVALVKLDSSLSRNSVRIQFNTASGLVGDSGGDMRYNTAMPADSALEMTPMMFPVIVTGGRINARGTMTGLAIPD